MSSPSLCHSILPVEKTRYSIEICYKLLWEWRDFGAKPSGTTELQQKVQQYLQPLGYEIDFSKDSTKSALIQLTQAVYRIKRAYRSTKDQSKRQRLRKTQSYCLQIDPDAMKLTPARAIQQLVAEKQAAEARIEKRSYQEYVESCLPEWRKKVREYQQHSGGKLQLHGATKNNTRDENPVFLGSTTLPKHKSESTLLAGPGMAGHQLLLPQQFPESWQPSTAVSTARQLQDSLSWAASDSHHVHALSGKLSHTEDSDLRQSVTSAHSSHRVSYTVDHKKRFGSVAIGTSLSAVSLSLSQPTLHSTNVVSCHSGPGHLPPVGQTLKLNSASSATQQCGDLSASSVSDDESLSEGELPILDDQIISPVQVPVTFPAKQVAASFLKGSGIQLSNRQHIPLLNQLSVHDEMDQNKNGMPPLTLSQLQPRVEKSSIPQSIGDAVECLQDVEDRETHGNEAVAEFQLEDVSIDQCNSSVHSDVSVEREVANQKVTVRAETMSTEKPSKEEMFSSTISSVSSLSLPAPAADDPSGVSEENESDMRDMKKPSVNSENCQSRENLPDLSQYLPHEDVSDKSVTQSSVRDELNMSSQSDSLQPGDQPHVDVSHLKRLVTAIEHDLDVGMEVDDLYLAQSCSQGMKRRIKEALDNGGDLEQFGANGLTAVVLEELRDLCAGDSGSLIPLILLKKHTPVCKTESQFRATLSPEWVPCWDWLVSHLQNLVQKHALPTQAAATAFAPVLIPPAITNLQKQEKALQILSVVLEDACKQREAAVVASSDIIDQPSAGDTSSVFVPSDSDMSLSLAGDLGKADNPLDRPDSAVQLSKTDAYRQLVVASKSDHLDDDAAFSVSEDSAVAALENDLGTTGQSVITLEAEAQSSGLMHSVAKGDSEAVEEEPRKEDEVDTVSGLTISTSSVSYPVSSQVVKLPLRLSSQNERPISQTSISYLQDSDPESEVADEVWPGNAPQDGDDRDKLSDQDDFDFYD